MTIMKLCFLHYNLDELDWQDLKMSSAPAIIHENDILIDSYQIQVISELKMNQQYEKLVGSIQKMKYVKSKFKPCLTKLK